MQERKREASKDIGTSEGFVGGFAVAFATGASAAHNRALWKIRHNGRRRKTCWRHHP